MVPAAAADLMFVVTLCHGGKVSSASFILSLERATASASALDARRTLLGVLADVAKQNAGRCYFRELCFALPLRGVR